MPRKRTWLLITAVLAGGALAWADEIYRVLNGPKDFYFGRISLTDVRNDALDPRVLREGAQAPEPAGLNLPLGPGDTIRTSRDRRVEIRFDNGTVVRLDTDSELKIESILAQGLSSDSKMTNLVLAKGRVSVAYKEYSGRELFQIITPKAAFKLNDGSAGLIALTADGSTDVRMLSGQATALYGAGLDSPKKMALAFKARAMFLPDNRFAVLKPLPPDEFETWNQSLDKESADLEKGRSAVPPMVRRLFPAIYDWAGRFADRYGKWIYDDFFGFVWRPDYNDSYPAGTWRPYNAGSWSYYKNGMYWVPTEPWGWIPYHLGVWHWNAKQGWFWIPGTDFSPAWVHWDFIGGTSVWRPWSMWDYADWRMVWWQAWCLYDRIGYSVASSWQWMAWWTSPMDPGPTGFTWWGAPFYVYGSNPWNAKAKPSSGPNDKDRWPRPDSLQFPLSGPMKAGLDSLMAALWKGDPAAVESFRAHGRIADVAAAKDLLAPDVMSKAVPLESFLAVIAALPESDPVRILAAAPSAGKTWPEYFSAMNARPEEQEIPAGGGSRIVESPLTACAGDLFPGLSRAVRALAPKPALRTIDWNPDVRLAERMGASLQYRSGLNEIVSPEIKLASGGPRSYDRDRRNAEADRGRAVASGSGEPSSGGAAPSAGTGSGAASSGTGAASTSSGASASSGSGHVVIKK